MLVKARFGRLRWLLQWFQWLIRTSDRPNELANRDGQGVFNGAQSTNHCNAQFEKENNRVPNCRECQFHVKHRHAIVNQVSACICRSQKGVAILVKQL